jgi:hypothetical protein
MSATSVVLSVDESRRMTLRAQGLLGSITPRTGSRAVGALLRRLGAVQLDTISVLARSHELVAYARLGPIGRAAVEDAYWGGQAIEYWSHAACVLPIEYWPFYAFRRRWFAERGMRWHDRPPESVFGEVRARLADGPLTANELGGARRGGPWWDWSATKIAVEFLLDTGEVVCTRRVGWRRVYDLPERALPPPIREADTLDDSTCHRELVRRAGTALGIGTVADLADYPRLKRDQVLAVVADSGLVPVLVGGRRAAAWADPAALAALGTRGRHRTTLLSPFDSLLWDRARTRRVFGFTHALEAYKPAIRREHGYFAMPLLTQGRLCGRVDPKRIGDTLVGRSVSLDSRAAVQPMADALREAATWIGCTAARVERVTPVELAAPLGAAIGAD